jgi:hypothetical protein
MRESRRADLKDATVAETTPPKHDLRDQSVPKHQRNRNARSVVDSHHWREHLAIGRATVLVATRVRDA